MCWRSSGFWSTTSTLGGLTAVFLMLKVLMCFMSILIISNVYINTFLQKTYTSFSVTSFSFVFIRHFPFQPNFDWILYTICKGKIHWRVSIKKKVLKWLVNKPETSYIKHVCVTVCAVMNIMYVYSWWELYLWQEGNLWRLPSQHISWCRFKMNVTWRTYRLPEIYINV